VLDIISTAREFLAEVGYEIPLFKKVKFLSGGEQQAIILARAIAFHPGFFIWDEPFSAIDFRKRETLYRILTRYWDANSSSIVLITHSIEEVIALAHRLIVFDEKMSLLLDQEVSLSQSNNATFPHPISKMWTDLPHE
jgi:sulfonate transport system ATP-binding protein